MCRRLLILALSWSERTTLGDVGECAIRTGPLLLRLRDPRSPLARAIRSRQIQQGVVAQAVGVTLAKARDLDDAESEKFPCGFGLTIRSERGSAVLDDLP